MISKNELIHYIIVYGVLAYSWPHLMDALVMVELTLLAGFILFVVTDKFAHKLMGLP